VGQDAKMPPPADMQLIQHLALDCSAVTDRRRQRTTTRVIAAAAATMATVVREPQLIADIYTHTHTHTDEKTTIRMIAVVTRRYKCRSDINLAWRSVVEAWLSLNVLTFQSCLTSPVQYAERKCAENSNK